MRALSGEYSGINLFRAQSSRQRLTRIVEAVQHRRLPEIQLAELQSLQVSADSLAGFPQTLQGPALRRLQQPGARLVDHVSDRGPPGAAAAAAFGPGCRLSGGAGAAAVLVPKGARRRRAWTALETPGQTLAARGRSPAEPILVQERAASASNARRAGHREADDPLATVTHAGGARFAAMGRQADAIFLLLLLLLVSPSLRFPLIAGALASGGRAGRRAASARARSFRRPHAAKPMVAAREARLPPAPATIAHSFPERGRLIRWALSPLGTARSRRLPGTQPPLLALFSTPRPLERVPLPPGRPAWAPRPTGKPASEKERSKTTRAQPLVALLLCKPCKAATDSLARQGPALLPLPRPLPSSTKNCAFRRACKHKRRRAEVCGREIVRLL